MTTTDEGPERDVSCPFCGASNVTRDSSFGPEISKSQYYCNDCETPFERIKLGDPERPDTGR